MNNRINVKNVHYAKNTVSEGGVITRGTPTLISGAMKISANPKVASGNQYGDGALSDEVSKLTGCDISLEMNKIPTSILNEIFGKEKDSNGITHDNVSNQSVEFSIGWEFELTGGQSEFIWFTRCKAQPKQDEVQQSTDNVNFSSDTLTITALPDENGDVRLFGETVDKTFKCATTWFKSVPPTPPVPGA